MFNTKPAKGTRDLLPKEVRRRQYVTDIIREVYELHGFDPLSTPSFERLETLLGKYGEEGDQLIFRVMKRGANLQRTLDGSPTQNNLADLGLRYDLTVPLARVVAQHSGVLPQVFKRYQIQPVWRADRPQKGRFREFCQCDVDVVGCEGLTAEAEVMSAVSMVLKRLGFNNLKISLNHRDLLFGLIEVAGIPAEKEQVALVAIDKLDKIGWDGVTREFESRELPASAIEKLKPVLAAESDSPDATLERLSSLLATSERGSRGVEELRALMSLISHTSAGALISIDPSLARGLSYYTGAIFEVVSPDFRGSLGGGGRYDGLVGMFQKRSVPAVGFSLGLDRLEIVMADLGLFDVAAKSGPQVMVAVMSEALTSEAVSLASALRHSGLRVDLHPGVAKMGKQFKYAGQRGVEFVAIVGKDEVASGEVSIKNLKTREQTSVQRGEVAAVLLDAFEKSGSEARRDD